MPHSRGAHTNSHLIAGVVVFVFAAFLQQCQSLPLELFCAVAVPASLLPALHPDRVLVGVEEGEAVQEVPLPSPVPPGTERPAGLIKGPHLERARALTQSVGEESLEGGSVGIAASVAV